MNYYEQELAQIKKGFDQIRYIDAELAEHITNAFFELGLAFGRAGEVMAAYTQRMQIDPPFVDEDVWDTGEDSDPNGPWSTGD